MYMLEIYIFLDKYALVSTCECINIYFRKFVTLSNEFGLDIHLIFTLDLEIRLYE